MSHGEEEVWTPKKKRKDECNFLIFGVNLLCDKKKGERCTHLSSKVTQKRRKMDASRHAVVCFRTQEDETPKKNLLLRYFLIYTVRMHVRYE